MKKRKHIDKKNAAETAATTPVSVSLHIELPVTVTNDALWKQADTYKKLYDVVRSTGLPNFMQARLPVLSGLCIPAWRLLLADFPDTSSVDLLEFGWPIYYTSLKVPTTTFQNHSPSADADLHIQKCITKELALRAYLGPFSSPPFEPWSQVSPKKNTSEKRIIDLSFPPGKSVNAGITRGYYLGFKFNSTLPNG